MKIAIHPTKDSFSEKWIFYCEQNKIDFKIVDCYANDIMEQMEDCDALMWHWHQADSKAVICARQIIYSLEMAGKVVFPDIKTSWHFNDKLAQKYMLEAANASFADVFVSYNKQEAIRWARAAAFPKVFKLRGGAGSMNVELVENKRKALKIIKKAFKNGFSIYNRIESLRDRLEKYKAGRGSLWTVAKGFVRLIVPTKFSKINGREKGYVYFQEFLPDNAFDIRFIVIGNRGYGYKRLVRKNDFRASGSQQFVYGDIDLNVVKQAFDVCDKLKLQCVAFDFIYDDMNVPKIVELSYGFGTKGAVLCDGYWDRDLKWHEGSFIQENWMVDALETESQVNH